MNKLRLKGIPHTIPVRVTKTHGVHNATEKIGTVYNGFFALHVLLGEPMRLLYKNAHKWFRSSPVTSISHHEDHTTVKTMHSTYRVEAL